MARITIRLPDDLDKDVEEHIGYANKSDFYREAAREKLDREADRDDAEDHENDRDSTDDGDVAEQPAE